MGTSSYSNPFKHRILTQLASVLGQLCNDEETRQLLCNEYPVIECLLYVFDTAAMPHAEQLKSKVMFALKQLCANSSENKHKVGAHVISNVVAELGNREYQTKTDWAANGILLLNILAIYKPNCKLMETAGIQDVIKSMMSSGLGQMETTRDRITQLSERIRKAVLT